MNSDRPAQTVPWECLTAAAQTPYLREADEYVSQSVQHGSEPEIAKEEFDDAVRQTAKDIYYETHPAKAVKTGQPLFPKPTIEEQARAVSAVLNKRVFAYRDADGLLVMAAAPLSRSAQLVAAYDKGRKIDLSPEEVPRLGISRRRGQRISL